MNRGRSGHWSTRHDASCDTIKVGEASCHCTLPKGFLILAVGKLGGRERLCRWYVCVEVCAMWGCEQSAGRWATIRKKSVLRVRRWEGESVQKGGAEREGKWGEVAGAREVDRTRPRTVGRGQAEQRGGKRDCWCPFCIIAEGKESRRLFCETSALSSSTRRSGQVSKT